MQLSLSSKKSNLILFAAAGVNVAAGLVFIILGLSRPVDLVFAVLNAGSLMLMSFMILAGIFTNKVIGITLFITGFIFSFVFTWLLMETPLLVAGSMLIAVSAVLALRSLLSAGN